MAGDRSPKMAGQQSQLSNASVWGMWTPALRGKEKLWLLNKTTPLTPTPFQFLQRLWRNWERRLKMLEATKLRVDEVFSYCKVLEFPINFGAVLNSLINRNLNSLQSLTTPGKWFFFSNETFSSNAVMAESPQFSFKNVFMDRSWEFTNNECKLLV